jgi:copper homeostasis protein
MSIIEVCAPNLQSAVAARDGGAHRIELCSALGVGGITPSPGLIRAAIVRAQIPVCVLIRPREGNFVFSPEEVELMAQDVRFCRENGAAGVVVGALTSTRAIDVRALEPLLAEAGDMELVFHRAFDFVADDHAALELLIDMGFKRILSSGQQADAWSGRQKLAEWVALAKGRITIMPGSGISVKNIGAIREATGATEFHLSAKEWVEQPTDHVVAGLETGYWASSAEIVEAAVRV